MRLLPAKCPSSSRATRLLPAPGLAAITIAGTGAPSGASPISTRCSMADVSASLRLGSARANFVNIVVGAGVLAGNAPKPPKRPARSRGSRVVFVMTDPLIFISRKSVEPCWQRNFVHQKSVTPVMKTYNRHDTKCSTASFGPGGF